MVLVAEGTPREGRPWPKEKAAIKERWREVRERRCAADLLHLGQPPRACHDTFLQVAIDHNTVMHAGVAGPLWKFAGAVRPSWLSITT